MFEAVVDENVTREMRSAHLESFLVQIKRARQERRLTGRDNVGLLLNHINLDALSYKDNL